jgi:hypothetical protein
VAKRIGECTNEKELIEAVEAARERRLTLRRGHECVWWENIALLSGDHYAQWDPTLGKFYETIPDEGKVRMVLNHALTVSRTELAKLTRQRPIMDVIPNSNEDEDISAAKVGRSILDAAWWKFHLRSVRKQALWWALGTGLGAVYVGWDPYNNDSGDYEFLIDPNTNEAVLDPEREEELNELFQQGLIPEPVREKYALGDIELKTFSPFQLLPDETKLDFNEIKNLITTEIVDLDVAKDTWGKAASKLHPEKVQLGVVERRTIEKAGVPWNTREAGRAENALAVHTFWLLPGCYGGTYLKNGIMLRWANKDTLLEISTTEKGKPVYPFRDNRMPFAFFQHIPSHMSIWPESTLQHIRQANLEMDKTASMLLEARNYMANPIWLVATQHRIKGKIKNVAGSIVRYTHHPNVPPPERVEGTQLPPQVENLMAAMRSEILEISGQGETSRGNVPSGVRSGVAVAYLQEEDETRLGPTVEDFEDGLSVVGSLVLSRAAQFYSIERTLRVHRSDGFWDVVKFRGADLRGQTDVITQAGSALPRHKAAKQQFVLDLVQMGIETDPKRINQMLELGEGEPDAHDLSASQAQRENMIMMRGVKMGMVEMQQGEGEGQEQPMAIPVENWHLHDVHLDKHYKVMMSTEYEQAIKDPQWGQIIMRLFQEHTGMHEQVKQQQMQQQLEMMQAQQGGPKQDGAGPDVMAGGGDPSAQMAEQPQ